jgi:multidrug efflux pump subunit AcrA (membrane-fusion protein)
MKSINRSSYQDFKKKGYYILFGGLFGFIIWASIYTLNQGVFGTGFVVSKNEKITITSPTSGLILELNKKPGDKVRENEEIILFDTKIFAASADARRRNMEAKQKELENAEALVEANIMTVNGLTPYQSRLSVAEAEYLETKARLDQMKVTSPVDGTLMNVSVKSSGVSVSQGQHLLDISPDSKDFQIQAKISVSLGDKILTGMPVDISFPTLTGSTTKRLMGKLDYISADKIEDRQGQNAYLEARVTIDNPEKIEGLRSGLPATVIIKTGPQTLLSYIIRPITDRFNRGMQ